MAFYVTKAKYMELLNKGINQYCDDDDAKEHPEDLATWVEVSNNMIMMILSSIDPSNGSPDLP